MKKVLLGALAMMTAVSIYAQGTINFANTATTRVMVDDGTGAVNVPTGATYQVGLWWAPAGTTDLSSFAKAGGNASFAPLAGMFSGGTITVPAGSGVSGIAPGAAVAIQIRGWRAADGSYDTALLRGASSIMQLAATGNPTTTPPGTAASLTGIFQPFTMTIVPEPSTIALGLLGLAGLFVLRRRS